MRSVIAAWLIVMAAPAWAETETPTTPDTVAPERQEAQAGTADVAGGLPEGVVVPPAIAAWKGTGFYPPEFCQRVHYLDRRIPQYWSIRRWCDRREQRGSGDWN